MSTIRSYSTSEHVIIGVFFALPRICSKAHGVNGVFRVCIKETLLADFPNAQSQSPSDIENRLLAGCDVLSFASTRLLMHTWSRASMRD